MTVAIGGAHRIGPLLRVPDKYTPSSLSPKDTTKGLKYYDVVLSRCQHLISVCTLIFVVTAAGRLRERGTDLSHKISQVGRLR
jgi:hypothetical protein